MDKKVVLVTGCSSGIGLELVKLFIDNGYITYGVARREVNLPNLNYIPCDVTDFEECKLVIDKIIEEQGQIDILINNAGMGISGPIEYANKAEVRKIFDVNFFGAWNMMRGILPYMREKRKGNIVNVSSVASYVDIPFQAFYSASKSALDSLSASLRSEVKEFGINVVTVHPGDAKTGFTGAREKNELKGSDPYASTCNSSIAQMEKDEQNGMESKDVAKVIFKTAIKDKPKLRTIVGFKYKVFSALLYLMPLRLREWAVRKMYFKDAKQSEIEIIEPDVNKGKE